MKYLIPIALAVFFSLLAHFAGGSLGAHKLNKKGAVNPETGKDYGGVMPFKMTLLPEIVFGLLTAIAVGWDRSLLVFALAWINTFFAFNTGHGTILDPREAVRGRKQFLSWVVDPLCRLFRKPLGGAFYHWTFMGLKGLWIGAFIFPYGLPLAYLWPAAYRYFKGGNKELASGAAFGACIGFYIIGRFF